MSAFVIANVRRVINPSLEIAEYLRRINDTLDPFGGRFRVHDTPPLVLEATWGLGVIVIEFPGYGSARSWYESADYQEIGHLRTDNPASATSGFTARPPAQDPPLTAGPTLTS